MRHEIVRFERNRTTATGNRFIQIALCPKNNGQIGMSLGAIRLQPERTPITSRRLAELALHEQQIAQTFVDAANIYAKSPGAMQLRAMNLMYEATKERGMTIVIPSAMADSMNPSSLGGLLAASASPGVESLLARSQRVAG